jgi:hypothetical protein
MIVDDLTPRPELDALRCSTCQQPRPLWPRALPGLTNARAAAGRNDFRRIGYTGPVRLRANRIAISSSYTHSTESSISPGASRQEVEQAMATTSGDGKGMQGLPLISVSRDPVVERKAGSDPAPRGLCRSCTHGQNRETRRRPPPTAM